MNELTDWDIHAELPMGKTLLLEASAGTGKTWQIEGLLVRLVAEYDLPIDRILVITFTKAATAELRDRIRKRLLAARDAMDQPDEPADDPILQALWADPSCRELRRSRLAAALSSFDLAPISTIHGFSQRMLDQLAFESGQEPGLELLTDAGPLLAQLVDDALARVYATASEADLLLLQDMGWQRDTLERLARAMTKAVAPVLEPALPDPSAQAVDVSTILAEWRVACAELNAYLASGGAKAAQDAFVAEAGRGKLSRLKGRTFTPTKLLGWLAELDDWLLGGTPRAERKNTWAKNLAMSKLVAAWKPDPTEIEAFDALPLYQRVEALFATQDRLWPLPCVAFAAQARARVEAELLRRGQLSYSTMLSRLAERILAQSSLPLAEQTLARAIRTRYDVALVDEFQDTDGAQWPVMRRVFAHPERRLLIIGDPKQAIYAFRGADVHIYLDAARVADTRATMRTNWRSDAAYVRAMNQLWAQGAGSFLLDEVDYVKVEASPSHQQPGIRGLPAQGARARRAFELRWVDGETLQTGLRIATSKEAAEEAVARYAALEAARLLAGDVALFTAREGQPEPSWSALRPGDIAVLVRTNSQAERVRSYLDRLGIPSVSGGRGSVLLSPVLGWLCSWLDAVAAPGQDRLARVLATTPLFGWTARELATALAAADQAGQGTLIGPMKAAQGQWERWLTSIQRWAQRWPTHGFVRVFEGALDRFGVLEQLLGARRGERYATDLRHLIELCHAEERRTRIGPAGLASWLRAARDAAQDGQDEAAAVRLESDAHAVQLVTIHKSKGLEYPVVLLPFGWADRQPRSASGPLEWHARVDDRTELRLNLEPLGTPGRQRAVDHNAAEARQEQRRLLYVALTRAAHHCVAWLGPLGKSALNSDSYALGRLALRERDPSGEPTPGGAGVVFDSHSTRSGAASLQKKAQAREQAWQQVQQRLDLLADTSDGSLGWSREGPFEPAPARVLHDLDRRPLRARRWSARRSLISPWQVSSYSRMVAGRTFDASEPQRLGELLPEVEGAGPFNPSSAHAGGQADLGEPLNVSPELDVPIPTEGLFGGPDVGTWVHAVLEHLDFQRCAASDGRDLSTLLTDVGVRAGVRDPAQRQQLAAALPAILDTPLDGGGSGLPEGFCLRQLGAADRLDELGFDLRLGAGNGWRPGVEAGQINQEGVALALSPVAGDAPWGVEAWVRAILARAEREGKGVLPRIAGILTGFVDLTLRVPLPAGASDHPQRYYVADYKTNRIAPTGQRRNSRLFHYTRPWMAWEMAHHGYHLQSLLYTVALHRLLRQRLPHYHYDTHVGGHLYLFLRGMIGPSRPQPGGSALGVYFDRWPRGVVLGVDAALSGRSSDQVRAILAASDHAGADT